MLLALLLSRIPPPGMGIEYPYQVIASSHGWSFSVSLSLSATKALDLSLLDLSLFTVNFWNGQLQVKESIDSNKGKGSVQVWNFVLFEGFAHKYPALTRVNPGWPIKPGTRSLDRVNLRVRFHNYDLN